MCFEFSAAVSAVKSEAMNQRFHRARQHCTELQEGLSEANNKISRAVLVCLFILQLHFYSFCPNECCNRPQEKAILSTQVWTLEKELKKLKGKMTASDKENQVPS